MSPRDEKAFTLAEMMVSMAALGILMMGLAQFFVNFYRAAQQSRSYSTVDQNLTLMTDKIAATLKAAAQGGAPSESPMQFVGVNGDTPTGFINSGDTAHDELVDDSLPSDHSDRIHFHANISPKEFSSTSEYVSDRVYYAFWVNGESTPHNVKSEFRNRWGVLMRKDYHNRGDTAHVPVYDNVTSPKLDINTNDESHSQVDPLGINVDYLQFTYYRAADDKWYQSWNTTDSSKFPADNEFPDAVRIAVRGYDSRANETSVSDRVTVPPQWRTTTVSLRGSE
ncbi:MAG: PilW family protein [bacterium]